MRTIHKYPLRIADQQYVDMPAGYKILSVALQDETICLWAVIDDAQSSKHKVCISIYPIGGRGPTSQDVFIGTVVMRQFVWHVYETRL